MHEFWDAPFEMGVGEYIYAKVIAINERGSSVTSAQNPEGAKVEVVPSQMTSPTRGSDTDAYQVHLNWVAPFDGDSPIQSYELALLDSSGDVWTAIIGTDEMGNFLGLEHTMTDNVVPGDSYTFKIRAKNKWGWGDYSDPTVTV